MGCAFERKAVFARGGHSNRLCTNTRDRGQELGQAVKAKNLEGQAVKGTSQIRKSQGSSTVKGQPDTKSHQSMIPHLVEQVRSRVKGLFEWRSSGQGPNSRSNFLTAVAGVSTESMSDLPLYCVQDFSFLCVMSGTKHRTARRKKRRPPVNRYFRSEPVATALSSPPGPSIPGFSTPDPSTTPGLSIPGPSSIPGLSATPCFSTTPGFSATSDPSTSAPPADQQLRTGS